VIAGDIRSCIRRRHPFFQHSDAAFFIVPEGDKDLGRIAVLEHRPYNRHHGTKTAFFCFFDVHNNQAAALALLQGAREWASARGLDRLIGPKGFMRSSPQGLLVEGFEYFPATGMPWNPPYYAEFLESAGFSRETDLLSGYLDFSATGDEQLYRVAAIAKKREAFRVITLPRRREIRKLLP